MTDNCFLCLKPALYLKCPGQICKMKAHKKCWNEYCNQSINNICPVCRCFPKSKTYTTRSKTEYINEIKNYFILINTTPFIYDKKEIAKKMFNFMLENMYFMKNNPPFKSAVKRRLIFFYKNNKWFFAKEMYYKMFNENIPNS